MRVQTSQLSPPQQDPTTVQTPPGLLVAEEGAGLACVPLKTSVKLKDLHHKLRRAAHSRGARMRRGSGGLGVEEQEGDEDRLRAGRTRTTQAVSGNAILSALWSDVAKPIVKHLTDSKKPVSLIPICFVLPIEISSQKVAEGRKRIWWCAVGQFVFMHIHATGSYSSSLLISASDFFFRHIFLYGGSP